jgi:hypothetical protein
VQGVNYRWITSALSQKPNLPIKPLLHGQSFAFFSNVVCQKVVHFGIKNTVTTRIFLPKSCGQKSEIIAG